MDGGSSTGMLIHRPAPGLQDNSGIVELWANAGRYQRGRQRQIRTLIGLILYQAEYELIRGRASASWRGPAIHIVFDSKNVDGGQVHHASAVSRLAIATLLAQANPTSIPRVNQNGRTL
jgi:hypothetical protein